MPKYTATVAYNVPCYATVEYEAADDAAAIEEAKKIARDATGEPEWALADEHRVVDVKRGHCADEDAEDGEIVPGSEAIEV